MRWRRKRSERDFTSELEAHLALEADRFRAQSLSEQKALQMARHSFGSVSQSEERFYESQRVRWLDHVKQDLAYGFRQLMKNKSFTALVVATLALGIGSASSIFTLIDATILGRLPYRDGDRIMRIVDQRVNGRSTAGLVSVPRFFDLEKRSSCFDSVAFYYFEKTTLIAGSSLPVPLNGVDVNSSFWRTIGIQPMLGRTFNASDDRPHAPPVAIISYTVWQREFGGDPHVLARQVTLDGLPTNIVGVLSADASYPSKTDVWVPAGFDPVEWTNRGEGTRFINVLGRLKPDASFEQGREDLKALGERLRKEYSSTDGNWSFGMEPLREFLYGPFRRPMLVLMAASGVLLLMACINIANLLLSRGTSRGQEVSVRFALGASRGRILAQFLTENILLALLGGGLGLLSTYIGLRWFGTHLPGRLGTADIHVSWAVVWFTVGISMATGVVFGCVPAIQSRRLDLHASLKQGDIRVAQAGGGRLRVAFISVQVAFSLILLVGASLLGRSLWKLLKSPLGFETQHVLTFNIKLPWTGKPVVVQEFYDQLLSRTRVMRGVSWVGHVSALPTVDWHLRSNFDVDWKERTQRGDAVNVEDRAIGGDYFKAMGIPLLAGRYLTEADRQAKPPKAIVNREFVRAYGSGRDIIGHRLINKITEFEIIGVVGDVRGTAGSIAAPAGPEFYFLCDNDDLSRSFVVRSSVTADQLARVIREQVREIDPTQAVQKIATFDELLEHSVAQPKFNMALLGVFALVAILLASAGIYGVISYAVAQRSAEVGIRMTFGATREQVLFLFIRQTLLTTFVGIAIGASGAWFFTRLLQSQLYGVPAHDWASLVGSAFVIVVASLLASLVPAVRAASLDPSLTLRGE